MQNCILDDGNNELVKRLPKIVRNCEVEVNHVEPFYLLSYCDEWIGNIKVRVLLKKETLAFVNGKNAVFLC